MSGFISQKMARHIKAESIENLKLGKVWMKLTAEQQAAWIDALQPHIGLSQSFSKWATFVVQFVATKPAKAMCESISSNRRVTSLCGRIWLGSCRGNGETPVR